MKPLTEHELKDGSILATANGFFGEDDFYAMYDLIKEIVAPDHITFGVDSMCVDGSFRKGDILVRISSESAYDFCCFLYDPASMTAADQAQVKAWIDAVIERLNAERTPHFDVDDDY